MALVMSSQHGKELVYVLFFGLKWSRTYKRIHHLCKLNKKAIDIVNMLNYYYYYFNSTRKLVLRSNSVTSVALVMGVLCPSLIKLYLSDLN